MNFLYSSFLYALGLLAIPVIIHLFYFRRFKTVYFSNISFLKTLKEETSARSKIKNLLVLLMRLLALAALVFAFAQPFLNKEDEGDLKQKAISIFVDNSLSMQAKNGEVQLFEIARQKAHEIVEAYDLTNKFHVFSHDMLPQNQRLVDKDEALSIIESLKLTSKVQKGKKIISKQKRILSGELSPQSYIISDFQKSIFDPSIFKDTTFKATCIYVRAIKENNMAIDSCWFEGPVMPNQPNQLIARFHNYGREAQDLNAHVSYAEQNFPMGAKRVGAQSSVLDTISMNMNEVGWQTATLSISDYPISFDDDYYIAFSVADKMHILSINETTPDKYINAAFQKSDYTVLTNVLSSKVQFSAFSNQNLIVLNGIKNISSGLTASLEKYVALGGNVIFFPAEEGNISSYNTLMSGMSADNIEGMKKEVSSVKDINTEAFIFKDVYKGQLRHLSLPTTQMNLTFTRRALKHTEYLMRYKNGENFVSKYNHDRGHFVVCSAPLNEKVNDLVKNAEIFVPLIFRTALSKGYKEQISYTIGDEARIEMPNSSETEDEMVFKISNKDGVEFIPEVQNRLGKIILSTKDQVTQPGFYTVKLADKIKSKIAFNYNRLESDMDFYGKNELSDMSNNRLKIIDDMNTNTLTDLIVSNRDNALWRWLLMAALLFLLLEALILRFWKT